MPNFLFSLDGIDLNRVIYDQEAIRRINPQRGLMEHLNAVVHLDPSKGRVVGYKDVRDDEFWVAGHIPGRPLVPGVVLIEAAAQLCSFYTREVMKWEGFIGFGGVNEVRFRQQVVPGDRLYLLVQKERDRHRRVSSGVQGIVNGKIAFDGEIIGVKL